MQIVRSHDDLYRVLDGLFADETRRWNRFFSSLPADHPLATSLPDEHLVELISERALQKGRALDLGCGNGRNSVFLARNGFEVDANDISEVALEITSAAAEGAGVRVNCIQGAFYDLQWSPFSYDVIYDFGCLHHVHPHRRPGYLDFISKSLKPGGLLVLGCFNEKMGSMKPDAEILKSFNMEGGLSFSQERLSALFHPRFELQFYRPMRVCNSELSGVGWEHMSVSLWKKTAS